MEDAPQSNSFVPPSLAALDEGFAGSWGRMRDQQGVCSFAQDQDLVDSDGDPFQWMLCVSGSKVVTSGKNEISSTDVVLFVNAGGGVLDENSSLRIGDDSFFQGGDVLRTDERIVGAGSCPTTLYQSARFGNFSYTFDGLDPGKYFVDLHFAEIVYTNGPKGIRVFNVFVQEEKVLSELDIYAVVGANKSLQIIDVGVTVSEHGVIFIKFEGVHGSASVSGICIRKAHATLDPLRKGEHLLCMKCTSEMEVSPTQNRAWNAKSTVRYEKKIEELQTLCKRKTDECYEAWMSLRAANEKLEELRMELDTKFFQAETLDQTVRNQTDKLKDICAKYEKDKKHWAAVLSQLEAKIQTMKKEQAQLSHDAHECTSSIPQLNEMVIGIQALVLQCENLKLKYSEEQVKRKRLYNQVQEAKGNIRVFCRCRPLSKAEVASGYATVIDFEGAKDGDLGLSVGGSTKKIFRFDQVYTPKDDQVNVFADASPLVTSVLDGYNVCIFAYGQTGTGKTFTMEGTEQNRGVNYRTLEELFKVAKERCETFSYNISVSVLEVYNEQIRDLLATSPSDKKLEVRKASEGAHHVPGIVEAKVQNTREVWDVLQAGSNARVVGSNNVNEHSSRSHCMLCIMVRAKSLVNGECTNSKLWLVDLAGSERLAKTDVQGERLKEAQNINRSLSALGDVISALATKNSHIPYRNSKLTHLLQDSLGGDSKVLMFVQVSPSENDYGETLSSLNFATRVRGVELGPPKKQMDMAELQRTKQMLDKAKHECRSKEESIRKLEESYQNLESKLRGKDQLFRNLQEKVTELEEGYQNLESKLKGKDQLCRNLQEKVTELECQVQSKTVLQTLSEGQHLQYAEALKTKEERCITLQQKVKELENKLKDQEPSSLLQNKVKELEYKLREKQIHESTLEQKIKELKRRQSESDIEHKVMELENKHSEYKLSAIHSTDMKGTPADRGEVSKDESIDEMDPHILRNSNSINHPTAQHKSILLKGLDSLHELKRRRKSETENNIGALGGLQEKKTIFSEVTSRHRKIDSSKVYERLTRPSRVVATQRAQPHIVHNKEHPHAGTTTKERERGRMWSR